MSVTLFLILQLSVAVGAYIQATIGFAMGLVMMGVMAIIGGFKILPFDELTILIMLLAVPNVVVSLRGKKNILRQIKVAPFFWVVPIGTIVGVYILYTLTHYPWGYKILYFIVGLFILLAALILIFRPKPKPRKSPIGIFYLYSTLAGLTSGLFAAASPPMVYLLYQQPWSINGIRRMLLTMFLFSLTARVTVTAWDGKITFTLLTLFLSLLPTVAIFSFLGQKYRTYIRPLYIRRFAVTLLGLGGINILYKAYLL